jgi:hypothetical protein
MTRDSRPELNTPWSGDLPSAFGLYDPANEHDACGVSFVVDIKGRATHEIVAMGIGAICNLEHRGAQGPRRTPATAPASRSDPRPLP